VIIKDKLFAYCDDLFITEFAVQAKEILANCIEEGNKLKK